MKFLSVLYLLCIIFLFSACDKDRDILIDNPISYDFNRNNESTVSFEGQTTRILMGDEFITALSDFSVSEDKLRELFSNETSEGGDANPFINELLNASTKSIRSKIAASNDFFTANTAESAEIKADFDSWITGQVNEVFPRRNELASKGNAGQIADGTTVRYINAKGLEYNQMINKSLIGALMVDQISNHYLSSDVLDESDNRELNDSEATVEGKSYTRMEHKWDEAYGYLFGASTDKINPLLTLGEDKFLNKYLGRVNDDIDFSGIATDIFNAFKLGRAAIVAGDYVVRDEQSEIIKGLVGQVVGIRAVYYLQQAKNVLPRTSNNFGPAFHDLSEGLGFIYSLRFIRKANSSEALFSKNEVDGFIYELLNNNGFWDVTPSLLDNISVSIASKFDFTVSQAGE
jgi:hypothetical protein